MYSILRSYYPEATTGILVDDAGNGLCVTLERPWLDNSPNTLVWPQNNSSCIPEGTYNVVPYNSPTKGDVWLLQGVQDRSEIEIHSCNEVMQLLGCIGVGQDLSDDVVYQGVTYKYWITNSKATLAFLKKTLPSNFVLDIRKG